MKVMLSTIDNPFNPFEDFNSCSYLARIAKTSNEFTEEEEAEEIERAIDEIIQYDFMNLYIKVKQPDSEED